MIDLDEVELQIMEIDERLRPIANRPVDITDPNWPALARQRPPALDEAGVRPATMAVLKMLIEEYQKCGPGEHKAIRELYGRYRSFAWAASLQGELTTDADFRRHLVLFSIKDQGSDSRDAILELQDLCGRASAAGVKTGPILRQVAGLSSDENKYGMGSTKSMRLNRV
jgi:hypothetical protein